MLISGKSSCADSRPLRKMISSSAVVCSAVFSSIIPNVSVKVIDTPSLRLVKFGSVHALSKLVQSEDGSHREQEG